MELKLDTADERTRGFTQNVDDPRQNIQVSDDEPKMVKHING